MNIVRYDNEEWDSVSETIHMAVFEEYRPKSLSRIDFVLAAWEDEKPIGYITCREMDSESIYIGYGGTLPDSRGNGEAGIALGFGLNSLKKKYKRASMLVKNDNFRMMKLAMKFDFKITGIRNAEGDIFLEHTIRWGE